MSDLATFAASLISSSAVKQFTGDEITVTSGAYTSDPFYATVIQDHGLLEETGQGQLVKWNGIAIQFDVADLVLNGTVTEPATGMTISWDGRTYTVQPPPGSDQCFTPMAARTRGLMYAVQTG